MESGQPPQFLWQKEGQRYYRYVNGKKCYLWQDHTLHCTPGFGGYVEEMLRSQDDLEGIYGEIATDDIMKKAIARYRGLRLTKNDPWETLVSFVCSINNNIPRICRNVQSLMHEGKILAPEELLKANLQECKLGYREDFLSRIAEAAPSLDKIGRMDYEDAKQGLMELPGVGDKVADCVLLFGYGFLEAFPVDVWIRRAMREYYGVSKPKDVRAYANKKWGAYAGYAQQYLYCMIRGM